VILGEEEEEDEDEEWTSPQDGYVSGPEPPLMLKLVLQRTGNTRSTGHRPRAIPFNIWYRQPVRGRRWGWKKRPPPCLDRWQARYYL